MHQHIRMIFGDPPMRFIYLGAVDEIMEEVQAEETTYVTVIYPAHPNRTQERELLRQLGVVRGLYNHFLGECIADYIESPGYPDPRTMNKVITQMRKDRPEMRSVNVFTLRDAPLRVSAAMKRFTELSARTGILHIPRFKPESRYRRPWRPHGGSRCPGCHPEGRVSLRSR